MVKAYLDDTGAEQFIGFGGFAGKLEAWNALEPAWVVRNHLHCISEFHAKEYPKLIPDYVSLALQYDVFLVGYTVDVKSYKEYARRTLRNEFGINEFASAAAGCAHQIFDWLHWNEDECALIVECQGEYAASIIDAINDDASRRERNPLVSLTILNEENRSLFPMRQAADLGANLTAKHTAAQHYGLRIEKDLSPQFFERRHFLGITHCPPDNIERMADVFTDPKWRNFF